MTLCNLPPSYSYDAITYCFRKVPPCKKHNGDQEKCFKKIIDFRDLWIIYLYNPYMGLRNEYYNLFLPITDNLLMYSHSFYKFMMIRIIMETQKV